MRAVRPPVEDTKTIFESPSRFQVLLRFGLKKPSLLFYMRFGWQVFPQVVPAQNTPRNPRVVCFVQARRMAESLARPQLRRTLARILEARVFCAADALL